MYSIRIQEDNNPYHKLRCLDETGTEILISTISTTPTVYDLHKSYFSIDTRHDETSSGPPVDDWAISEAFKTHSERFNAIRIIKMTKKLFSEMKDITNFATQFRGEVEYIENSSTNKKMDFQEFIKDILQIELYSEAASIQPLDPLPNVPTTPMTGATPTLSSCIKTTAGNSRVALYQYLKFFNIFDQGHQFPDKIPSPSYIIDSASTINTLDKVPNMCDSINFNDYTYLPGTPGYRHQDNRNLSLLFFGDLQIVDFYYEIMNLNFIIDGTNNGISIDKNSFFSMTDPAGLGAHTGMTDAHKKLIYCSVIALNIFWQYVLSYVKIYTDLHKDNVSESVKILRHWVFTYVELNNNTQKPEFKGKFFKTINNTSDHITKIPFWFLQNHDELVATPFVRNEMKDPVDPTKIFSMNVSQSSCAKLINSISPGTAGPRSDKEPNESIFKAIEHYFVANDATQTYKIHMGQILKFSGDKSHQTASELLNRVFKSREAFKDMIGCVNTGDRPLMVGCILDNRPFIMPDVSVRMIDDFGYKRTTEDEIYIAFYIPKTKITILDRIKQKVREINSYISNIKELCQYNYEKTKKDALIDELILVIFKNMTYIYLFYLSFFSFETVVGGRIYGLNYLHNTPIPKNNTKFLASDTIVQDKFKLETDRLPNSLIPLPNLNILSNIIIDFNDVYALKATTLNDNFENIFNAYNKVRLKILVKDNSFDLMNEFYQDLSMTPPPNEDDTNGPKIHFPPPSLDVLTLCKLYKAEDDIGLKETYYDNMFAGNTNLPTPLFDPTKNYENIFMYNKEYKGHQLLLDAYIPLLNLNNIFNFYKPQTSQTSQMKHPNYYFTFNTEERYELVAGTMSPTYYSFEPFINVPPPTGGAPLFINKLRNTPPNLKQATEENNESLNYIMVFQQLIKYIDSVCRIIEINKKIYNQTILPQNIKDICNSRHCMRIIYFTLGFFRHRSTVNHIQKGRKLFYLPPPKFPSTFPSLPQSLSPTVNPITPIEVIGLFTITKEGAFVKIVSNRMSRSASSAPPGDETKIDGLYYISRTILKKSFVDLKNKLKEFLKLNSQNTEYQEIII